METGRLPWGRGAGELGDQDRSPHLTPVRGPGGTSPEPWGTLWS